MTSFHGITRLVVEGFRGSTSHLELTFDPGRPFVLIFGENGTGKSSIVDAIEYALYGTKGSLSDVSSTEIRHLASLGTSAPLLRVELHAGGHAWTTGLRGSRRQSSGTGHVPRVKILRRARLARIVAATPAERYAEKLGIDVAREIDNLVIHGVLHLAGYDHETDQGEMTRLERRLRRELIGR